MNKKKKRLLIVILIILFLILIFALLFHFVLKNDNDKLATMGNKDYFNKDEKKVKEDNNNSSNNIIENHPIESETPIEEFIPEEDDKPVTNDNKAPVIKNEVKPKQTYTNSNLNNNVDVNKNNTTSSSSSTDNSSSKEEDSVIKYYVVFNDIENGKVVDSYTQQFTYDVSTKLVLNSFEKENYSFVSWNTKEDGSGTTYFNNQSVLNLTSKNDDIINLYAQWKKNTYYVLFDANGGIGSMNELEIPLNETMNLTSNSFTNSGYKFNSWNTKEDGSGISYSENQEVTSLTYVAGKKITLYAQWVLDSAEIIDGKSLNSKIKKLANDTDTSFSSGADNNY